MSFCRAHLVLGLEFPALVQVQDRHRYLQGHLSEASRRLHAPWRGAVHSSFTHATCSGSSVYNRSVTRAESGCTSKTLAAATARRPRGLAAADRRRRLRDGACPGHGSHPGPRPAHERGGRPGRGDRGGVGRAGSIAREEARSFPRIRPVGTPLGEDVRTLP